jgi:LysM repeat protein
MGIVRNMINSQYQIKKRNGFRAVYFILLVLFSISCSSSKKTTTAPATEAYRPHTVQRGETISKIANTYDVTLVQIAAINPGLDLNKIKAGQVIKIPFKKETKKEQAEEKKEPEPVKKSQTTHVALLLPFNAAHNMENQVDDAISVDPATVPWIQFYEGVMIALDSLTAEGNNYELRLYDTWMDSTKLSRLIRDTLFTKNDLVIAGSVTSFLPQLATAASSSHKPLIITQNNSATFLDGHPDLLLATPSVALQCQLMSNFIYREFENENLVILHQDTKKENDLAAIFSTALQIRRLST